MFIHRWYFKGFINQIIDDQTMSIRVDLGFDVWKIISVRFNRLKIEEGKNTAEFLKQYLVGKKAYFQIFKRKDYDLFYAEIYCSPGDLPIQLKDLNRGLKNPYRIDGFINVNDILVSQGYASYFKFHKDEKHA